MFFGVPFHVYLLSISAIEFHDTCHAWPVKPSIWFLKKFRVRVNVIFFAAFHHDRKKKGIFGWNRSLSVCPLSASFSKKKLCGEWQDVQPQNTISRKIQEELCQLINWKRFSRSIRFLFWFISILRVLWKQNDNNAPLCGATSCDIFLSKEIVSTTDTRQCISVVQLWWKDYTSKHRN